MANPVAGNPAVIHIVVVGFHHKKGCQVEYSYPPLIDGESHESTNVPEEWKYLPFLALPDGAHNYTEDTIYFHLPPRSHYASKTTVYGVSCYRQISAHLLKRKDADVTRETVQKSVVVLSQMPIYGILHAKLQMITQAYFEEKDFAKNDILKELFEHVNLSISRVEDSQKYLGLSSRSLVLKFHHKIVMLFKLLLLERRVVFHASPVRKLVGGIMALLSLYPDMIDKGMSQCTTTFHQHAESVKTDSCVSDEAESTSLNTNDFDSQFSVEETITSEVVDNSLKSCYDTVVDPKEGNVQRTLDNKPQASDYANCDESATTHIIQSEKLGNEYDDRGRAIKDNLVHDDIIISSLSENPAVPSKSTQSSTSNIWDVTSETALSVAANFSSKFESLSSTITNSFYNHENVEVSQMDLVDEIEDDDDNFTSSFGNSRLEIKTDSPAKRLSPMNVTPSNDMNIPRIAESHLHKIMKLDNYKDHLSTNAYGFPLSIFTRGYVCYPYISLQQFSDLTANLERGYIVGATNILFKTQTHLADVVVDMENATLEIRDNNLKRLLHLSAADLRFAEHLVNNVTDPGVDDFFLDATGWEGGDEWIQARFMDYIVSLLAMSTEVNANPKEVHDFNEYFLAAWKQTQNYKVWVAGEHPTIADANSSHPFQAQYSVSDVRLRLHHNLQSTDRGKKIEDAMTSANQAVVNTGKFMGTALVSAKSSMASWWSSKMKKET